MKTLLITASILLATGGTIGYVLLPEDHPQYTPQERAWIEAARADYQSPEQAWRHNVTMGDPMEASDDFARDQIGRAADIARDARLQFIERHETADGRVVSLYNATVAALHAMEEAARTMHDCLDCPHARVLMDSALAESERIDKAWNEALA